jgi:hypothetical protein
MIYVFSPSTLGFYDPSNKAAYVAAGTWPSDTVEITDDTAKIYLGQAPDGQTLGADADGNPAWVAVTPPTLTLKQQASQALYTGLTVYSTSLPEFNSIYAVDPTAQGRVGAISTYILVNDKFPGGLQTYPWLDISGNAHIIASTSMFQEFATQVADYVAILDFIAVTGEGSLPSNVVIIS